MTRLLIEHRALSLLGLRRDDRASIIEPYHRAVFERSNLNQLSGSLKLPEAFRLKIRAKSPSAVQH